ncbi:MAG: dihydrodipicolinate reductase [Deltaproteobacteria bacterium]|jgi:4-hydroxy-tetrahydrodipicolinate reductase|nr:dihydrodipicolinate reductase [Deltaproteobacteria bacterium]
MDKIKVMVNGMPGNVAVLVAKHILTDSRFDLIRASLTGPEIQEDEYRLEDVTVNLIRPENREKIIQEINDTHAAFLSVDYTHPSAVNGNAEFYCKNGLHFVMGTTGGDRKALEETVLSSSIAAVIAPNMARQIVGFQAMMEYAANTFRDLFKGYSLEIRESHQHGKADTSGTARAMVGYFKQLGLAFDAKDIVMERDPEIQKSEWGIPEAYLTGHGWHTYSLVSEDKTVRFEFTHNVNGRDVYAKGTLEALEYLQHKINQDARGKVFTMIDVLKGN